jgi:8-oxo-dGTP pyrophosphatase MutT (NUDIX family)
MSGGAYRSRRPLGHGGIGDGEAPVAPRDAATLIVWRRGADGPEVLLGRRSKRAAFVPEFFVFPGGRFDDGDRTARPASPLDAAAVPRMAVRGDEAFATALAMTAARETEEETGLMLASGGDVGAAAPAAWAPWRRAGVAPDLARLAYFGRAITSAASPIRFHARFFVAEAGAFTGALGGAGELSDLAFYPLREALGTLPVVDVTEFMLNRLWAFAADARALGPRTPRFGYRDDRPHVTYE